VSALFGEWWSDAVLIALLLLLIGVPVVLVWRRNNAGAAVIVAAISAAILFTRLPDIQSFKLFGLVATLERQQRQVQVTLAQLQGLAASLATGSFNELAFSGQVFVGMPTREKFQIHDRIVASLKSLGLSRSDILKTQELWIYFWCNILEEMVVRRAQVSIPTLKLLDELKELSQGTGQQGGLPSPDTLYSWVVSKGLKDPNIDQLLGEYQNVWLTGTMKDPDLIPFGSAPSAGVAELPRSPAPGGAFNNGGVLSGPSRRP